MRWITILILVLISGCASFQGGTATARIKSSKEMDNRPSCSAELEVSIKF